MLVDSLLDRLTKTLRDTVEKGRQDTSTQKLLLFLANCITVIAFSGPRRLRIGENTLQCMLRMTSFFTIDQRGLTPPYSPTDCLHILLSRSR